MEKLLPTHASVGLAGLLVHFFVDGGELAFELAQTLEDFQLLAGVLLTATTNSLTTP